MKFVATFLAVLLLTLPCLAQEDKWENPADEVLLTREMPFSVAVGAGSYIGVKALTNVIGVEPGYAKWLALGGTLAGAYYKESVIDHAVNGQQASYVDIGWTMAGAGLAAFITDKKAKTEPHASLGIKGKQLVWSWLFF